MPSENSLKAASVPTAMTQAFRSQPQRLAFSGRPSRRVRDWADRRARMRSTVAVAVIRPRSAARGRSSAVVEQVVHHAAGESPQQAVERVPHRQARQQLQRAGAPTSPSASSIESSGQMATIGRRPWRRAGAGRSARKNTLRIARPAATADGASDSRKKTRRLRRAGAASSRTTERRSRYAKLCCFIQLTL